MLRIGDIGDKVKTLQRQLANQGFNVDDDAVFGERTQQAVKSFQAKKGLVIDGVVGDKTRQALTQQHNPMLDKQLKQAHLKLAAKELAVSLGTIMAVNLVESQSSGFLPDGRPKILFERHVMYRRLKAAGLPADELAVKYPKLVNKKPGAYRGGWAEHTRLESAKTIDHDIALESCSWGQYQLMGYHWQTLGFESVQAFVAAMQTGEKQQLEAFVSFIKADTKLHTALKKQDWPTFAKLYNGPNYKANFYDARLALAYESFKDAA